MLFFAVAQSTQAGLIIEDKEWEVRGASIRHEFHVLDAAMDMGWIWASAEDVIAAEIVGTTYFDPDWSRLMGALDGLAIIPDAWLSDPIVPPDLPFIPAGSGRLTRASNQANHSQGRYFGTTTNFTELPAYRLSYRPVSVPATVSLFGVSLALMGWSRRQRAQ